MDIKRAQSVLVIVLALVLYRPDGDLLGNLRDITTADSTCSIPGQSIRPGPHVLRANVDKTSSGCFEVLQSASLDLQAHTSELAFTHASHRPGVVPGCSPLASRPPPLA